MCTDKILPVEMIRSNVSSSYLNNASHSRVDKKIKDWCYPYYKNTFTGMRIFLNQNNIKQNNQR
jgi:hypothetical protein